jgi:acyl carrier protein
MVLNDFIELFAEELEDTPIENVTATTLFRELDEWSSLTALSIISMVDENFEKRLTGADLRSVETLEELYNLVLAK